MKIKIEFVKITEAFLKKGGRAALKKMQDDFVMLSAAEFERRLNELLNFRERKPHPAIPRQNRRERNQRQRLSQIHHHRRPPIILEAEIVDPGRPTNIPKGG